MKKITVDDFVNYKSLSDLMVSNDKNKVAFTVHQANMEDDKYHSDVYLLDLVSKHVSTLTDTKLSSVAFWLDDCLVVQEKSKDGLSLYKVSNSNKNLLCYLPSGASNIIYNKGTIYYLDIYDSNESKDGDCYRIIDEIPFWLDGFGYSNKKRKRLYAYSISDGSTKAITEPLTEVHSYRVYDDKLLIVASTFTDKKIGTQEILIYSDGVLSVALNQGLYAVSGATYIGHDLVFMGTDMKKYGVKENPSLFKIVNGHASMVHYYDHAFVASINNDCRKGSGYTSRSDEKSFHFLSAHGIDSSIVSMSLDTIDIVKDLGVISCFDLLDDGYIFVSAMKNKLSEIYSYKNGQVSQLTHLNESIYNDRYIAPLEEFYFSHKDVKMHGMILQPYGYEEGKSYPGILMMHGGPKSIYGRNFMHQMQYMASEGYFVFFTNPVGSCGRGNDFSNITGELGHLDYDIFMKFTDVVLDKYPVDPDNLFVTGGSYGGFMTNWMIGHTHRFNAAVSQRSISNWFSKITSTDIGYYYNIDQMPGSPWTDPELMWDRSPLKYADKVKTPTLFVHGEKDRRCGLIESQQMFLALKYHDVDARLVILNDSSHNAMSQGKPQVRRVWLDEMNKWFKNYRK